MLSETAKSAGVRTELRKGEFGMQKFVHIVDTINRYIGKTVSLLVPVMVLIIIYEVFMRYLFNAPTAWVHDMSGWLQAAYIMLGGAYALQKDYFVRVDILYTKFPPKIKALIDLTLSSVLFFLFLYIIIWRGWLFAYKSFSLAEVSATGAWAGRVWPAKMSVPIGGLLLALAWISKMLQNLSLLAKKDG